MIGMIIEIKMEIIKEMKMEMEANSRETREIRANLGRGNNNSEIIILQKRIPEIIILEIILEANSWGKREIRANLGRGNNKSRNYNSTKKYSRNNNSGKLFGNNHSGNSGSKFLRDKRDKS